MGETKKTQTAKERPTTKLTAKQKRFVSEYLIDNNGTQAAIRAGYSEKTANEQAARLLAKDSVQKAVQEARTQREKRTLINADYVLSTFQEVVERCMQRAPVLDRKGDQVQDENGNNLWTFDSKGANRALELLGKHLGMFQARPYLTAEEKAFVKRTTSKVKAQKMSPSEAALDFDARNLHLPEGLRTLLAKEEPAQVDPTGGAYSTLSEEDFRRQLEERSKLVQEQIEGLPQRRAEIEELRKSTADTFSQTEGQDMPELPDDGEE